MGSPLLWGPNNISNNLQGSLLLSDGTLIDYNGNKNYIALGNFENQATTGWSLGTVGTLTNGLPTGTPTFGSGAAVSLSTAITTSANLALAASLQLISSAATTQGNMLASQAYAIDRADQARVLTVQFSFAATVGAAVSNFSGTSSNSWAWAVWDVTNSSWLTSAGNFNLVQNSGTGYCTGTVQTNSTTASIRLVIYAANATTGAVTLTLDQFYVGPQTAPMGPAISDWVAYTPVFTGFGTPTSVNIQWRRVGDSVQIRGTFITGTTTAVTAAIGLPSGLTSADTTKIPAIQICGEFFRNVGTVSNSFVTLISPSQTSFNLGLFTNSGQPFSTVTGSGAFASSETESFMAQIPIQGWSSNTVSSADTDTRLIDLKVQGAPATVSAGNPIIWPTVMTDKAGGYNATTGRYTVSISGDYVVQAAVNGTFAAGNGLQIYKNAVADVYFAFSNANGQAGGSGFISCIAGDIIDVRPSATLTTPTGALNNNLSIFRLSGPAVVQATESVNAVYINTAGTTVPSSGLTTIPFATRVFDSHSAFNTTNANVFTCPVSGKYSVSLNLTTVSVTLSTTQIFSIAAVQSGSASVTRTLGYVNGNGAAVSYALNGSASFNCAAGDTIAFQAVSSVATTLLNSATSNYFSVVRVGN